MGAAAQTETASKQWTVLITTAFRRRIRPDQLTEALHEQWCKARIPGTTLVSHILDSGARLSSGVDPLIPAYLDEVIKVTSIDVSDVLIALLSHSRYSSGSQVVLKSPGYDLLLLESVLALLLRLLISGERPRTAQESRRAVRALAEWLTACNYHETMLQVQAEGLRAPESSVISALETLGTLAYTLFTNKTTRQDILKSWSRDLKDRLAFALNNFAALLNQWTSSPVAARLQMITRTPPLASGQPEFSMAEIASAVLDLPVSTSRTGLYVYLNAALCARPLTDDLTLLNYLHSKYRDDAQSLIVDLIGASFDTLANALHRHQTTQSLLCYRSFIANKLPLLISSLSGSLFPQSNAQICIQTALSRIDVHPFPPLSAENDGVNEGLRNSRQQFVQACVMHQLGSEAAFSSVIGDHVTPVPSRGSRYTKDGLASQCMANVHRVDQLVRELETMNGNAGAISCALVETLQHFCTTKETMSLRTLCNAMTRRLPLLDIIFQYVQPTDLLLPLCKTLNEWTHDEDQSEFQPPYEEFASILLLVLAVFHRYQISESDIGLTRDTFVFDLLTHLSDSVPTSALTQEQGKHLSKWMQGLYATDEHGETNGISDETMSHCPPQAFYLLVPTLLEQSIYGCKANALALNTLKGGLEFLLEPFLLPSLVGGLSWLTKHSWEDHGDADVLIQVLHKLLRPTSISGDAQAMHQTIITMIATPLERSLRELNRRMPNRKEIAMLIEILKPHLNSQHSGNSSITELDQWTSTPGGGLRRAMKDVIDGLISWSNQSAINPIPTNYTHRMFLFAVQSLGADEVLGVIVDEVKLQTQIGFGSSALEIATALICAPSPLQSTSLLSFDEATALSPNHRRTLRQALRHKLESPKDMLDLETDYVEALIRLGRRVDAQSAVSPINPISMSITSIESQDLMQDINMTGAGISGDDIGMQQTSGLRGGSSADFSGLGDSLDMNASDSTGLNSVNDPNAMSVDLSGHLFDPGQDLSFGMGNTSQTSGQNDTAQNTEDDIFAGLDMGDMGDDDFSFA